MFRRSTLSFGLILFVSITALAAPPTGVVTTIAGQPGVAGYWDGPAADAMFAHPTWLDVVAGNSVAHTCDPGKTGEIFVVDRINQLVRRISETGNVTTFRPNRGLGGPNDDLIALDFGGAFGGGILVEPPGAGCGCDRYARGLFIAASGKPQITLYNLDGRIASRDASIVIGSGQSGAADGFPSDATFGAPTSLARAANVKQVIGSGYLPPVLYIADSGNHTIRRVRFVDSFEACPVARNVDTFAGSPGQPGSVDGAGSAARFNTPRGLVALPDGTLYVSDAGNHTIRRITPDGTVTTIAGVPGVAGSDDGPALQAHLNTPSGIDVNDKGEIFIVDTFSHTIRMLKDGMLTTIAGQPGVSGFADGDAATAKFNAPVGLKIAPDGSLVVADTGNNVIRRLTLR